MKITYIFIFISNFDEGFVLKFSENLQMSAEF
jgi:hypothetical protein